MLRISGPNRRWLFPSLLAAAGALFTACGNTPPPAGSPVTAGSVKNTMPAPPAQTNVNRYVASDLGVASNAVDVDLWVSHPNNNYSYQQLGAAGTGTVNAISGGIFTNLSNLEYLSQTDVTVAGYTFAGFAVENQSDISLLAYGYGGGPYTADFEIGVPVAQTGCVAPDGTVPFVFLRIPVAVPLTYTAETDVLYGSGKLTYKDGKFSYSEIQEFAGGPGKVATYRTPFADSNCIQSFDGYAIQGAATHPSTSEADNMVVFLAPTGTFVGTINMSQTQPDGTYSIPMRAGIIGVIPGSQSIDLGKLTQATYKGFNLQPQSGTSANPAYFGIHSDWITSPVFAQASGELVGGFESPYNILFTNPAPQVAGNVRIRFGSADAANSALFPNASITEPDPSGMCPAAQQNTGSDGNIYCTFPVVALVEQSYSKFAIFIAGPEPTTGQSLFYALVQD